MIMATAALSRGIGVSPALVASGTFKLSVSTGEGVEIVIHLIQDQEGNRHGPKECGFGRGHQSHNLLTGVSFQQGGDFPTECGHGLVASRIVPGRFQCCNYCFGLDQKSF